MLSLHRSLQLMCTALFAVICSTALVGCTTHDRAESVPTTASPMTQGREQLTFTAPHDGMVYVEDSNDKKLVYSGQMRRNQKLSIDATKTENQIMLDGQTVIDRTLRAAHDYKIYFDDRMGTMHNSSSSSDRM
jgi:hypothetical protein